jgi:MFS family permease
MTDESPTPTATVTTPRRWWALVAVALGVSLIIMDATIVNVALPSIIEDLGLDATQAEWMNAIYSLVFAALLTVGRLATSSASGCSSSAWSCFVVASIRRCGWRAQRPLAARLLQGIGAAMILPSTPTLNAVFVGRERAICASPPGRDDRRHGRDRPARRRLAHHLLLLALGVLISVPVGIVVVVLILFAVPRRATDLAAQARSVRRRSRPSACRHRFSRSSRARTTGGGVRRTLNLTGPDRMAVGVLFMLRFWVVQRKRKAAGKVSIDLRPARRPLVPLRSIAALIVSLGEFGLLFTSPLCCRRAGLLRRSAPELIAALAIGTFVISGMTRSSPVSGGGRAVVRAGLATGRSR